MTSASNVLIPRRWRWGIYNALLLGSTIAGGLGGHPVAANVATFMTWLWVAMSTVALASDETREQVRRKGRPVPESIEWLANMAIMVAAAAAGWFGLAVLMWFAATCTAAVYADTRN